MIIATVSRIVRSIRTPIWVAVILAATCLVAPAGRAAGVPGGYRLAARWPGADVQSPAGTWVEPAGVDVAADGTVAVADAGNARVQLYGADGQLLRAVGRYGTGPGELITPRDVALSADRILVTDPPTGRVVTWRRDGTPADVISGFGEPWGIALAGDRVLVSDRQRGELVQLAADGSRLATWGHEGSRGGEFRRPAGLAVAPNGEVYVADTGNGRVQVLSPQGRFRDEIEAKEIAGPVVDLAVDARDNVFVVGGKAQWIERDAGGRVTNVNDLPVPAAAGVGLHPQYGLYFSRSAAASAIGEVVRLPYLVRGARPDRTLGSFGGAMGRIVEPRRLVAGPDSGLAVLAARTAAVYGPDGSFRSLLPVAPDDLLWLPDGDLVTLASDGLARLAPDGSERWHWPGPEGTPAYPGPDAPDQRFAWFTQIVYDPQAERLTVLDIGNGLLLHFALDGRLIRAIPIAADGTFASYRDVALRPDGLLILVNPVSGQIELRNADGVLRRAVAVRGSPQRVAVAGSRAFVLTADGWVWRFGEDLEPELAWPAADGGRPLDLVALGDDVFVLDGRHDQVLRWAYVPEGPSEPLPEPPAELRCTIGAAAAAVPTALLLGETVDLRLEVAGSCPELTPATDIVLTMDRSGSMLGEKLDAAKFAAQLFLDQVDFSQARVALVAFSHEAALDQELTDDEAALRAAVDALSAVGGTDIAGGLSVAHAELIGPRHRPAARSTIIVLTDGNSDTRSAVGAAVSAKLEGIWVFVIGLGEDVNTDLLRRLATSPGDYYAAPGADDLARVYTEIGQRIRADRLLRSATITQELPPDMTFVGMRAGPAPAVQGSSLVWTAAGVPFEGLELIYRLRPGRAGHQPAAVRTDLDYLDGLGRGGWLSVAPAWLTVLAPRVLPTPPPSPTPEPFPSLYLPILQRGHCVSVQQHAEVMLVLDASHSMEERTGSRSKLAAAIAAAGVFVDLMKLPADQIGLVTFNSAATLAAPLSGDGQAVRRALAGVSTAPGTRIDRGLDLAAAQLVGPGHRISNSRVIVLLTDGRPTGTTDEAVRASAAAARSGGVEIFAVGLGHDVDPALLESLTSGAGHLFLAPSGDDLERIYRAIAGTIPCR